MNAPAALDELSCLLFQGLLFARFAYFGPTEKDERFNLTSVADKSDLKITGDRPHRLPYCMTARALSLLNHFCP
jgi:hypothetical protein